MGKMARPTIVIKRIPTGDRELEDVMADVFLRLFEKRPKSSEERADTFVKGDFTEYNVGSHKKPEVKDDDTAA